ncbi:hypothetical protein [Nostoc sp. CCY 9925]|uniref:hypothetical protein n=1 Tax=Nostoc sp. CCY 9925 TaxID=3103865 RepID=UPI0039C6360A
MATINISDLRPTGSDLFSDSEGYMNELNDNEVDAIYGGYRRWQRVAASVSIVAISTLIVGPLIEAFGGKG